MYLHADWETVKLQLVQPSWPGNDDSNEGNRHYCAGGKIEKNEMGGACGAYGGWERCAQGSDW